MSEIKKNERDKCGIIMPISQIDGCNEQHWIDVKNILTEAINAANFDANLVSNADDIGIIQKRIVQNIYDNPIIVCDVSGKNPNVMFELGMRLAFDKPTIIVKDDNTTYSFDTSPIEHLTYPRDLRFNKIIDFKKELSEKIKATFQKAKNDSNFSTFLKHFGKFTVAKLETTEVSKEEFIIDEIRELRHLILSREKRDRYYYLDNQKPIDLEHEKCEEDMQRLLRKIIRESKGIDLSNAGNRNLIIDKALLRREELPPCFGDNDNCCIDKLKEQLDRIKK